MSPSNDSDAQTLPVRKLDIQSQSWNTQSDLNSSRQALQTEIYGKIIRNDANVFRRLRVQDVSDAFVDACAACLCEDNAAAIAKLKELERNATVTRKADNDGTGRKETEMYGPIRTILDYIRNFKEPTDGPLDVPASSEPTKRRVFLSGLKLKGNEMPHDFHFPGVIPDFTAITDGDDLGHTRTLWRVRDWFLELEAIREHSGSGITEPSPTDILFRCINYARLHLSARPFFLFSVGVTYAGSEVCAIICDRDGATVSPPLLLWDASNDTINMDAIKHFIRLIRSLTCICSLQDLGQDPTVTALQDDPVRQEIRLSISQARGAEVGRWESSIEKLQHDRHNLRPGNDEKRKQLDGELETAGKHLSLAKDEIRQPIYPSFVTSLGGRDSRRWCTIGAPIWSSLSLIGRGTSAWRVREYKDGALVGPELVMKNAWRNFDRASETSIYDRVKGTHPGLAVFRTGSDVYYPRPIDDPTKVPITVYGLRGTDVAQDGRDLCLHRIFLDTVGRPLWKYGSDFQLVMGLRSAVEAHMFLSDQGILHRDISAGNILLYESWPSQTGHAGFLTDLELAHVTTDTTVEEMSKDVVAVPPQLVTGRYPATSTTPPQSHHNAYSVDLKNAGMTGTTQFMAVDVLTAGMLGKNISRQPHHDLESFLWALGYCVMRHTDSIIATDTSIRKATLKAWSSLCKDGFQHTTLAGVRNSRKHKTPLLFHEDTQCPVDLLPVLERHISSEMRELLSAAAELVGDQLIAYSHGKRREPTLLTYASVLKIFDDAVAQMKLAAGMA